MQLRARAPQPAEHGRYDPFHMPPCDSCGSPDTHMELVMRRLPHGSAFHVSYCEECWEELLERLADDVSPVPGRINREALRRLAE